jgi:hypothetical protein
LDDEIDSVCTVQPSRRIVALAPVVVIDAPDNTVTPFEIDSIPLAPTIVLVDAKFEFGAVPVNSHAPLYTFVVVSVDDAAMLNVPAI